MRFAALDYYARNDSAEIRIGAIFRDVPVPYFAGTKLATIQPLADGRLAHGDFSAAWQRIAPNAREGGLPLLQRAKLRPAILLRVGTAMVDDTHLHDLWVAPLYSEKERARTGPNIFPLPASSDLGLVGSFVDFYQLLVVPRQHLGRQQYLCDLTPSARTLLWGALAAWAMGDP